MTKAEISYLLKNGFSLSEILALEAGDQLPPAEEAPAEPPAEEQPAGEAEEEKAPDAEAPDPALALAAEVKSLQATVKQLQAAALASLRQPGSDAQMTIEDIVAAM